MVFFIHVWRQHSNQYTFALHFNHITTTTYYYVGHQGTLIATFDLRFLSWKAPLQLSMSTEDPVTTDLLKLPCHRHLVVTTGDTPESDDEDTWFYPYGTGEIIWGILLVVGIFGVNFWVLWIVVHARELWKPRHLWMACLCVTDLFVGFHKIFELLLLVLPRSMKQLCIINKATLGIPYILNILLLTLLSLDRYIAVSYPFIYTSVASNKHVGIGFLSVLVTGLILSWSSIAIGLQDVVCRVHFLQLKYLIATLTLCSMLTLFFNVSVLRIAKKQLTAIYTNGSTRPRTVSVICSNCGHTTAATVSTLSDVTVPVIPLISSNDVIPKGGNELPLPTLNGEVAPFLESAIHCDDPVFDSHFDEIGLNGPQQIDGTTIIRASSLPQIVPTSSPIVDQLLEASLGEISMAERSLVERSLTPEETTESLRDGSDALGSLAVVPRRCRSLFSFSTLSIGRGQHAIHVPNGTRIHFFRYLHFSRAHVFHVGRLSPSIRFARTVLLIMIPMWIFILPVIIIIPLHRSCEVGTTYIGCSVVDTLWTYLLVHIRSVLLLQAILDTLIYACRSKEFKNAFKKFYKTNEIKKNKSTK